ncbi:transglycosylase domain-containing protein [Desulfobotulus mexicanus]|uniref:peptidoglycan glycosyltransferase n=1 Tax=Desulfobotulus mexicanus TaxID=2586642 RepID=A0A5S5MD41_9BACT|nr:transglycosylase domain-containing protein [Desulfobotulus mexicanus]TYT73611.1 penicillin-binding protein 1C [Desulfobotulus mexicanus]
MKRRLFTGVASVILILIFSGIWIISELRPLPPELKPGSRSERIRLLDYHGKPLTLSRDDELNTTDIANLDTIPLLLRQAILLAEDQRFFQHRGTDWKAVFHALFQNMRAGRNIRGASSITEQVIRILHPRPRTLSSRILESIEAHLLEHRFSKADILSFYLNQVPYPDRCRGVMQAANYLFDRDLSTLSNAEIITLAVLPRAPQALHPELYPERLKKRTADLALRMTEAGLLEKNSLENALKIPELKRASIPVHAPFFVSFVRERLHHSTTESTHIRTTLDASLQDRVQKLLDRRIEQMSSRKVNNGAVIVISHQTGEIRAWAVAGNKDERPGGKINAVLAPRQPGSALKPFAYAMALEKGWTAATPIEDTPISTPVGTGLHDYRNYSRNTYGTLPLRDALANSLNLAAIRTVRHVGTAPFLATLRDCGLQSLTRNADYYGDGLVLGNGEVSLLELTEAYAVFARDGQKVPLRFLADESRPLLPAKKIFHKDTARLIADILSDPEARKYEFGPLMNFPVQTAIKTGTSSDHRDAWAFGFDHKHTAGIWMGNLDRSPMQGLAGASGPLPLLRAIFNELNRNQPTRGLTPPEELVKKDICIQKKGAECTAFRSEWLPPMENNLPADLARTEEIRLLRPSDGLTLAMDPRVPLEHQRLVFSVEGAEEGALYRWYVNGQFFKESKTSDIEWQLYPGQHQIHVDILLDGRKTVQKKTEIQVMGGIRAKLQGDFLD